MSGIGIIGTGHYLPEKVMTNDDWAKIVDTTDEWITTRTGIKERHFAAAHEATSDLVVKAAEKAIAKAGIDKNDIDIVLVGTISPDNPYPSTGNWVQKKLGLRTIPSMDISAGCSGFIFGLITARSFIQSGLAKYVLVAGAEVMSRIINWEDRSTCVLFGDGAGAAVLGPVADGKGILSTYWGSDGNLGDLLIQPAGGSAMPASEETVREKKHTVHMAGNTIFKHAVLRMQESALKALEMANLKGEDLDLFIPHQANLRIIDATIKRANIPIEKTFINIHDTANISAATIPIALDQAIEAGRIPDGGLVLLASFGAGFTWGAAAIRF
jgi:3-oxoacyl-[acyl-carrier-protein] synthase-3